MVRVLGNPESLRKKEGRTSDLTKRGNSNVPVIIRVFSVVKADGGTPDYCLMFFGSEVGINNVLFGKGMR